MPSKALTKAVKPKNSLKKKLSLAEKKSRPIKKLSPKKTNKAPALVQIEKLHMVFSTRSSERPLEILKNINFTVNQRDTVAIMGKSGSGKSTLLSLITGLEKPSGGRVLIDNTNIFMLDEPSLTKFRGLNIAIVFQQFHLISHLTALENTMLPLHLTGRPHMAIQKAKKALAQVELSHREYFLPSHLSGGEQQRLAIARALCIQPKLLVADEPTGNLDDETSNTVMDSMFHVVKQNNITLLLVTHDKDLAKRCKKQFILERGELHPV